MITKDEVQKFLVQFHQKLKVFGIIYRDDRGKNQKTLQTICISFHIAEQPLLYPFKMEE